MGKLTQQRRKKLREELTLNKEQMAKLFGVGTATIGRWEQVNLFVSESHQRLYEALNTLYTTGKLREVVEIAREMQYGSKAFVSLVFREVYLEEEYTEDSLFID